MSEPDERLRERELERRRENERKDLDVEATHGERPLEGLSGAHTTWTDEQDESQARKVHEHDEAASRAASIAQIPPPPEESGEER